jgi:hypothetical protein
LIDGLMDELDSPYYNQGGSKFGDGLIDGLGMNE